MAILKSGEEHLAFWTAEEQDPRPDCFVYVIQAEGYTVKVEKDGIQHGPTYTVGVENAMEALYAALSIAKASPEEQVNAPRPYPARIRVVHFETQGDAARLAKEVEAFLNVPGREFVEMTHARTDPPNNTTAAFLLYRERGRS